MDRFIDRFARERRLARRHSLRTPLHVRIRRSAAAEEHSESENLSHRGVFFTTDLRLTEGAAVDLRLEMPREITGLEATQWLCTGHVVRVETAKRAGGAHGVAVQFDCYEIAPHCSPLNAMDLSRASLVPEGVARDARGSALPGLAAVQRWPLRAMKSAEFAKRGAYERHEAV